MIQVLDDYNIPTRFRSVNGNHFSAKCILTINDNMKHGKFKILLLVISVGLLGASCMKEDTDIDLSSKHWKVVKIKKEGQLTYTSADSTYMLRFSSNTEYKLDLDVNMCIGLYEVPNPGELEIQPMACTEVCCDSEFAEELAFLLPGMTRFYTMGDLLYLEGTGKIILQPY